MGAIILGGGGHARPKAYYQKKLKDDLPVAEVRVSIDSFAALPPYLAYDELINEAAKKYDVDADLIRAVIQTESAFNPLAESPVGAQGLMQLMPEVQLDFSVDNPFDPRQNIMAGVQYLKRLLTRHGGDIALALASYNAGPGNVTRYRGVPPFKETHVYVKKIKGILQEMAGD